MSEKIQCSDILVDRVTDTDQIAATAMAMRALTHDELEVLDPFVDENGNPLDPEGIHDLMRDGARVTAAFHRGTVAAVVMANNDPGLWIVNDQEIHAACDDQKIYAFVNPTYRNKYGLAHRWHECIQLMREDHPHPTRLMLAVASPEAMWGRQAELLADTLATNARERGRLVAMFTDARSGDCDVAARLQMLAEPGKAARLISAMRQCDYGSLHGRDMLQWGTFSQADLCVQLYKHAAKTSVAVVRLMETYPKALGTWRFIGLDARWAEPVFVLDAG